MANTQPIKKEYDAIVVGAGIAGLVCALKLASNGKKVLLLERQAEPGGVGTAFTRKGFTFEAVLHYVDALSPGGEMREFFDECKVSEKISYIELKGFGRVIYPEHDFLVTHDFKELSVWLKNQFPSETKGIDAFFSQCNTFYKQFDHFGNAKIPLWLKYVLLPVLYTSVIKTSCMTFEQFMTKKIKDKKLRALLGTLWGFIGLPPSEISALYYLIVFRGCWGQKTSFIKGGFSKLFFACVERLQELGSEVRFSTTVTKIITQGTIANAVITDKGEEFHGRVIISNASAVDTLTKLIDNEAIKNVYIKKFSTMQMSPSALTMYVGLNVSAKVLGMDQPVLNVSPTYDHDEGYRRCVSGEYNHSNFAIVDHSQLDPDLAPPGKSTLSIMTFARYADWNNLTKDEYAAKKKEVAKTIITHLEKYLPGLAAHVEFVEVGTPKTLERYAALPAGAVYGFSHNVQQSSINRLPQETSIKGLLLTGAWTKPGCGVHGCFVSGIDAADTALKTLR